MRAHVLTMALVVSTSTSAAVAADAPLPGSVQSAVAYGKLATCPKQEVGIAELGAAYFGGGQHLLQDDVTNIFGTCDELKKISITPYVIVVFLAKPTVAAPQATIAHFIYNASAQIPQGSAALPGIGVATWLYITEEILDVPMSQIVTTPVDNPLLGQLGPLAAAIDKVLPLNPAQKTQTLYVRVASSIGIPFKRSAIVESDFVATPRRDSNGDLLDDKGKIVKATVKDGHLVDDNGKPVTNVFQQVAGTVTFTNTPKTWVTANATAAVFVGPGPFHGDQKMKIDNKAYASDPLARGATMAGLTLHVPFDASAPGVSLREAVGLFVGGVLTPAGGVAVGGTLGSRTISLVGGYAWLFIHTAPSGKVPGNSVDAGANPQLVSGTSTAWFLGATYAFK